MTARPDPQDQTSAARDPAEVVLRPDNDVAEVYEGEIVDHAEVEREPPLLIARRISAAPARWVITRLPDKSRLGRAPKAGIKTAWMIGQGLGSWTGRAVGVLTYASLRRQLTAARIAGERPLELAIEKELRERQTARKIWIQDLPRTLVSLTVAAGIALGVVLAFLVIGGLFAQLSPGGWDWSSWWAGVAWLVLLAGAIIKWAVLVGAWAALPLTLWLAWREGERVGAPIPKFLVPEGHDGREIIPTNNSVLQALRYLGLVPLDKAFKAGWGSIEHPTQIFEQDIHRDGFGHRVMIRLPQGVPVEKIVERKDILAHNLVRLRAEVWLMEPKHKPGVMDLWIADQGALTKPVPEWPLLADLDAARADYFAGVPLGINIRRENVTGRLFEANYAVAGVMGSGKSTLVITLLLGAILDPLVDVDVVVMAQNADYEPMRPRLRSLVASADPSTIDVCMHLLQEAYSELEVRGRALREHDARAVTREIAEKDPRLRPRIIVIDECQALFMDEELGETARDTALKLMAAARKYAITLIFLTPEPSSDSLPRKIMAIVSCKACFSIGDQTSNDAVLGTSSYRTGISAVGLEPKTDEGLGDVGTSMTRGILAKPGLLRSYYLSQADAHRVTKRAMDIRAQHGLEPQAAPAADRDLLEDLDRVLGAERIPIADVPPLLSRLAPTWLPYRGMTGKQLRETLERDHGVKVASTGNKWPLDPAAVRAALARRPVSLDDAE